MMWGCYAGYVIAGTAGAVERSSRLALGLTATYAGICRWWVAVEERALQRRFGAEYQAFKATTPRWLGVLGLTKPSGVPAVLA